MEVIKFDKQINKEKFKRVETPTTFSSLVSEDGGLVIGGYFVVFNKVSTMRFREDGSRYLCIFPPNSMVLPDYDVVAYYNHNDDIILGRMSNGRLTISVDAIGCYSKISMTDTQKNRDYYKQVEARDLKGQSFGMYEIETRYETRVLRAEEVDPDTGLAQFVGEEFEFEIYDKWLLDEVTVTGRPAFPQSTLETFAKDAPTSGEIVGVEEKEKGESLWKDEIEVLRLQTEFLGLGVE